MNFESGQGGMQTVVLSVVIQSSKVLLLYIHSCFLIIFKHKLSGFCATPNVMVKDMTAPLQTFLKTICNPVFLYSIYLIHILNTLDVGICKRHFSGRFR
jgi:hypothetical protein